jgi:stearoyl-CoA desaturase (delta-9 desaturase)
MAFLDGVLQPPSYGWKDASGNFSKPTPAMIFREFFFQVKYCKKQEKLVAFF